MVHHPKKAEKPRKISIKGSRAPLEKKSEGDCPAVPVEAEATKGECSEKSHHVAGSGHKKTAQRAVLDLMAHKGGIDSRISDDESHSGKIPVGSGTGSVNRSHEVEEDEVVVLPQGITESARHEVINRFFVTSKDCGRATSLSASMGPAPPHAHVGKKNTNKGKRKELLEDVDEG